MRLASSWSFKAFSPLDEFLTPVSEEKRNANGARHQLKKIGTPSDIAEMAAFLLSEKSAWTTGQILHVDGGISNIKL